MVLIKDEVRQKCHDCSANVGEHHLAGCDTERCPKCGGQLISCDCFRIGNDGFDEVEFNKYELEVWSGIMFEDAKLYAEEHNLFCYDYDNKKCHDINTAMRKMPPFVSRYKTK